MDAPLASPSLLPTREGAGGVSPDFGFHTATLSLNVDKVRQKLRQASWRIRCYPVLGSGQIYGLFLVSHEFVCSSILHTKLFILGFLLNYVTFWQFTLFVRL